MSQKETLWTPQHIPPQLTSTGHDELLNQMLENGPVDLAVKAFDELRDSQPDFCFYLDEMALVLNSLSKEGPWPVRALRVGAALAYLGYQYSQQLVDIDETLDLTKEAAFREGVPEAYAANVYKDRLLADVIDAACEPAERKDGFFQISNMGAGCLRFHTERALLVA